MKTENKFASNTKAKTGSSVKTPLLKDAISAGFPSPAGDYIQNTIDLNEHLIRVPSATYLVRVKGRSMIEAGIYPGSLLVVDRSLSSHIKEGQICVVRLRDEFTVKRYFHKGDHIELHSENSEYKPLIVRPEDDFEVQGVVRFVINDVL